MKTAFALCLFALAHTGLCQDMSPVTTPDEVPADSSEPMVHPSPTTLAPKTPEPHSNTPTAHAGHEMSMPPTAAPTAHVHPTIMTTAKSAAISDSTTKSPTPTPTTMNPAHHNNTEPPNPGNGALRYQQPFFIVAFIVAVSLVTL